MYRIIVLLLALTIDLLFGDPPNRFHPLMLIGRWLSLGRKLLGGCSKLTTRNYFWFGAAWTIAGTTLFTLPFWLLTKKQRQSSPAAYRSPPAIPQLALFTLLDAFLLKPIFAYRGLRRAVNTVAGALADNDLNEARRLLSWHLVSRDTGELSEAEVAGAVIESLAENLTDSVTAPLLAYAAGGLPAAWAYRFINTADALWGYRTGELEHLGKFPARLDDALNWLPARLTGWLLVVAAWLTREDARNAAGTMLAQHHRPTSPNAGWTMSAMAGVLKVTLSKQGVYELVGGPEKPAVATIRRALRLADICVALSVIMIGAGLVTVKLWWWLKSK
jgi:adenosylcobinamide-phosphate synthase